MTTSHWRALPSWYSAANNRHQQITETLSNYWFQRIIDWMTVRYSSPTFIIAIVLP